MWSIVGAADLKVCCPLFAEAEEEPPWNGKAAIRSIPFSEPPSQKHYSGIGFTRFRGDCATARGAFRPSGTIFDAQC